MTLRFNNQVDDLTNIAADIGQDTNGVFVPFMEAFHARFFHDVYGRHGDIVYIYAGSATSLIVGDTKTVNTKTYYVVDTGQQDIGDATPFVKFALLSRYAPPEAPNIWQYYWGDLWSGRLHIEFGCADERAVDYYEIYRSFDRSNWHFLGTIAKGPFTDNGIPPLENLWYKIRTIDIYGRASSFTDELWFQCQWMRLDSNPILQLGAGAQWDDTYIWSPSLAYESGYYHLFYTGQNAAGENAIGHATLTAANWKAGNLAAAYWTKDAGNPVVAKAGAGYMANGVGEQSLVRYGAYWLLFYTGYDNHNGGGQDAAGIGLAYSPSLNGPWDILSNATPRLSLGAGGTWDDYDVFAAYVVFQNGFFHMFYSAGEDATNGWDIGYAYASDAVDVFAKGTSNPVLQHTASYGSGKYYKAPGNEWDSHMVCSPNVIASGTWLIFYYEGSSGAPFTEDSCFGTAWSGGPTSTIYKTPFNPDFRPAGAAASNDDFLRECDIFNDPGTQKWWMVYGSGPSNPARIPIEIRIARLWR